MKNCILAALLCTFSSAHVRMRYTGFSIRNAGAANADGKFSTAGPCGGAKTFGANGETAVLEGAEIELSIAYNGGHKSDTKNFFSVAYVCGKVNQFLKPFAGGAVKGNAQVSQAFADAGGMVLTAAQITSPSEYPVDATASLTSGYKIKFKVPKPTGTGADANKCTFSLVEYRNWGGCVDLSVTPRDPNAPTPPPPPPPSLRNNPALSLAQSYDVTDIDYTMNMAKNGNKCGGGDCACTTALKDSKCLWQKDKKNNGRCAVCQYKDTGGKYKDNCLCDVSADTPYIRHYGSCTRDSPNCLCLDGMITVWHQTGAAKGSVDVNARATDPENPDQIWALSSMVPVSEEGRALATAEPVTVRLTSGGETITQEIMVKSTPAGKGAKDAKKVHLSLTVVDAKPRICSVEATLTQSQAEVSRQDAAKPPRARDPPKALVRDAAAPAMANTFASCAIVLVSLLMMQ